MKNQLGSGILDSISNFFKSTGNKVSNWFSGKKQPVEIEMKNLKSERQLMNTKPHPQRREADAFFEEQRQLEKNGGNKHRNAGFFTPTQQMRMDRIANSPRPELVSKPFKPYQQTPKVQVNLKPYEHKPMQFVDNSKPKMTIKDRAIADYQMDRQRRDNIKKHSNSHLMNALDSLSSFDLQKHFK